jgi:predicted membrane chloride channel (bestrophin family)
VREVANRNWFLTLRRDVKVSEELLSHVFYLRVIIARFQAALSLMLGFYTSTIYGRWWAIRDVEGVVIGRINDLAPHIAGLIRDNLPPSHHDNTKWWWDT